MNEHPQPAVEYLPDASVSSELDEALRALLTTCFTKPQDDVFRQRRYFREPYTHRWVVRDASGRLIAHVGVHEKSIEAQGQRFQIGGICEVCVHPTARGQGLVKRMLAVVHDALVRWRCDYAVLFGDPAVYGSSGYVEVKNLVYDAEAPDGTTIRTPVPAMAKPLTARPWPLSEVYLPGPKF